MAGPLSSAGRAPQPHNFPDVTREFSGDHQRLALSLLQVLERTRDEHIQRIALVDAKDFSEYRFQRGQVDGLSIAISLCKDTQSKL